MRRLSYLACLLVLCAAGFVAPPTRAAEVVLAHPGSPYGDAILAVTKAILEDRLGVQVRILHASAPVAFKAMDANRGDIDVLGSMQLPNSQSLVDEYVTRRGTVVVAHNSWQFQQGLCTTRATADKYGIKSIYDMTRPEVVHLTAKGGDGRGEYWVGAADWNATAIDKVRARFYGLDQLYNLTTSQADLEYARVASAIKTGSPIFWACDTASNFIFAKGTLAMLDEPPHDPAKWHPILPSQDPDWYQKSRIETAWPPVRVAYAYAKHLQTDFPEVARCLEGIDLTAELVGGWTYATFSEKQDLDVFAKEWVAKNATTVNQWLKR
jgi:glycine betaine/proline transport system substrate-binding protein